MKIELNLDTHQLDTLVMALQGQRRRMAEALALWFSPDLNDRIHHIDLALDEIRKQRTDR